MKIFLMEQLGTPQPVIYLVLANTEKLAEEEVKKNNAGSWECRGNTVDFSKTTTGIVGKISVSSNPTLNLGALCAM